MKSFANSFPSTIHSTKCPLRSSQNFSKILKLHRHFRNLVYTSIAILILATVMHSSAQAEYYSAVEGVQKLFDIEKELVQAFHNHLDRQHAALESYRRFVKNIKIQHSIASQDVEDFFGNPINAFTFIKRMVTDWSYFNKSITQNEAQDEFSEKLRNFQKNEIQDDSELNGAVKGLLRLQKVYNLQAEDLANGRINGVNTGIDISWRDCFEIGTNLFDQKELEFALSWLDIALKKFDELDSETQNDATHRRFEIEILEYLALTNYELGNTEEAIEYIDEILNVSPNHHTKNLRLYIMNTPPKKPQLKDTNDQHTFYHNYTRLCQGVQIPQKRLRKLECSLDSRKNPQFILAPLKVEHLSEDPEIMLYHGLLTDTQIEQIVNESKGRMIRSLVRDNNNRDVPSDVRTSQQAWLGYKSPVMKSIYRLVEQVTGLDLANAEAMQVANYGVGGQYEGHHDFVSADFEDKRWPGRRIVTNMFYLSDVRLGGFTVFPYLNIYSRPIKGAMISWYNVHKSVNPDYRTLHAGCPVIIGSKRIGNIWIHAGFQEFRRPCDLINDSYKSQPYIDI